MFACSALDRLTTIVRVFERTANSVGVAKNITTISISVIGAAIVVVQTSLQGDRRNRFCMQSNLGEKNFLIDDYILVYPSAITLIKFNNLLRALSLGIVENARAICMT